MTKKPTAKPTAEQAADVAKVTEFLANGDVAEKVTQPALHDSDSFWASENPKITIRTQLGVALTFSTTGDLYIRQHASPRDSLIIITPPFQLEFLEDLCAALGVCPPLWKPKKLNEENKNK